MTTPALLRPLDALITPARTGLELARDVGAAWGGIWGALARPDGAVAMAWANYLLLAGEAARQKEVRAAVLATSSPAAELVRVAAVARAEGWTLETEKPDFVVARAANDVRLYAEADEEGLGVMVSVLTALPVSHHDLEAEVEYLEELRPLLPYVREFGWLDQVGYRARAGRAAVARSRLLLDDGRCTADGERLDHAWLRAHGFVEAPGEEGVRFGRGRLHVEYVGGTAEIYLGAAPARAGDWPPTLTD